MLKSTISCLVIMVFMAVNVKSTTGNTCSCSCGNNHALAIKQCAFTRHNSQDTGLLKSCDFRKVLANSALRVTFQGDLRMVGCTSGKCCRRWYITINGRECASPAAIDAVIYANLPLNLHRPATLDGFCKNIPKGRVIVGLAVGACPRTRYHTFPQGDAYTGWNSVSRLIIEEVPGLQ